MFVRAKIAYESEPGFWEIELHRTAPGSLHCCRNKVFLRKALVGFRQCMDMVLSLSHSACSAAKEENAETQKTRGKLKTATIGKANAKHLDFLDVILFKLSLPNTFCLYHNVCSIRSAILIAPPPSPPLPPIVPLPLLFPPPLPIPTPRCIPDHPFRLPRNPLLQQILPRRFRILLRRIFLRHNE